MIDKIIEKLEKKFGNNLQGDYYGGFNDGIDEAIDIVKQVAEEGDWIKCSDKKFPKFDEEVYVTLENGDAITSKFYGFGEECQGFKEFPTGVWEANQLGYEVIAWCRLPKPFKEAENGD